MLPEFAFIGAASACCNPYTEYAVAIRAAACWLAGCVARTFAARCVAALDDRQIFGNRELPVFNINLSSKPRPTDGAWYAADF